MIVSTWALLDAHLVALDAKTGSVVWDVELEDYRAGYSGTAVPLAIDGKIVVGVAGGGYGIRAVPFFYHTSTFLCFKACVEPTG